LRIEAQGNEYALSLTASELRTVVLSLLVLPDRYSDEAVQDLVGCSKQEISDLQIRISDGKYALDREKVRRELVEEGLLAGDSGDNLALQAKTLQELTDDLLEAARARAAAIEKRDIRRDILAEFSIFKLLGEISARPGGSDTLSELVTHDDAAIRFTIADQWRGIDRQVAVRILEDISHDVARPLLAYAAGFRYRQSESSPTD
jgi:hypothetical protein